MHYSNSHFPNKPRLGGYEHTLAGFLLDFFLCLFQILALHQKKPKLFVSLTSSH